MDKCEKILRDIRTVKIQGAESVAINAVKALEFRGLKCSSSSSAAFFSEMKKTRSSLFASRPTEPLMRNAIDHVLKLLESSDSNIIHLKKRLRIACSETLDHFDSARQIIAEIGSKKIENGMIVFTHCHSSTVMEVLKKAKSQGKRFHVYNTEARPLFQGRTSATELAKAGIPVTHFVDSAAKIAIKKSDMVLFGFDAVTTTKIYNKIGSDMFAMIADKYDVPIFACGDSWKFDPEGTKGREEKIEMRPSKEIWPGAPKGVKIENPCFEKIDPHLIAAIISELGVYPHENFIEEVKKAYPWLSR
jgi:ribose 1,5-bisphosphate isomerase